MATVNNRFCCFRVRAIGIVLGWLGIISGALYVVLTSLALDNINDIVALVEREYHVSADYVPEVFKVLLIALIVTFVLAAINLMSSILLIVGILKKRHLLIIPWMIKLALATIITVAVLILLITLKIQFGRNLASDGLAVVLTLGIDILLWIVILRLYRTIRDERDNGKNILLVSSTQPYKQF